jgi:hypothetical protein
MHLRLFAKRGGRLLRSDAIKANVIPLTGENIYTVECCKDYVLRIEFDAADGGWHYLQIAEDFCSYPCDYHSNCDLTVGKRPYLNYRTLYVNIAFHKLSRCRCVCSLRCYFGAPGTWERLIIFVDSANMLTIPGHGKVAAIVEAHWEATQ